MKYYKCENSLVFNKEEQRGATLFIAIFTWNKMQKPPKGCTDAIFFD